jgi:sirohydrochlorin ferrochelatase
MLARAAIRNPWVFRDFLPAAASDAPPPGAAAAWDGGRRWPNAAEVDAAAAAYAATAAAVGTKPKFVAFHERNFERRAAAIACRVVCWLLLSRNVRTRTSYARRLRRVAATGDRSLPVDSPATIHLT